MFNKKYRISIPRHMYWSTELENSKRCPSCRSRLKKIHQTYLLLVKTKREPDEFLIGCDGGYFCHRCPTVVLDKEEFTEMAKITTNAPYFGFKIVGIVDLDSIPEDKKDKLFDDDNPIPLVPFASINNISENNDSLANKSANKPMKDSKKIGRNQPCPCGSGKKYKKCCGRL
jgi:hypothetical protein